MVFPGNCLRRPCWLLPSALEPPEGSVPPASVCKTGEATWPQSLTHKVAQSSLVNEPLILLDFFEARLGRGVIIRAVAGELPGLRKEHRVSFSLT